MMFRIRLLNTSVVVRRAVQGQRNPSRSFSDKASTASSASSAAHKMPRVISRRAHQEHLRKQQTASKQTHSSSKKSSSSSKENEKPWPKSLQMAGYAMAAVFVPYSLAWFAASNGSARALLNSPTLDDFLRQYFGEPERHASVSYSDVQQGEVVPMQLDGEPPLRQRLQQAQVEALDKCRVKVRVRVMDAANDNNVTDNDIVETNLPGSTMARASDILATIGKGEETETTNVVALDFGAAIINAPATASDVGTDETRALVQEQQDDKEQLVLQGASNGDHIITKETNVYSLWHYVVPPIQQDQSSHGGGSNSTARLSSTDVQVARLEHDIQVLERDLVDVNCTRDRDDMVRELKEKRAALRSFKWKKRLGLL